MASSPLGKRPMRDLQSPSPRRQRSGSAPQSTPSPRRSRSGAGDTLVQNSLEYEMLCEVEARYGHGMQLRTPTDDIEPAASSFATVQALVVGGKSFLRLSLFSESKEVIDRMLKFADRPKTRMEIDHPKFVPHEEVNLVRADAPKPSLTKFPKNTTPFHNKILLLSSLTQDGRSYVGFAVCDSASATNLRLHMLKDTFARLRGVVGGKIEAVPVMNLQWATAQYDALLALEQLPRELLIKRDRALHYYMLPAQNPRPSHGDIAAWQQSPPFPLEQFNPEQREALALAATTPHGLVLIQGPPGTGKSHVIANGLVRLALELGRVVIACVSNKAIDALAVKLLEFVGKSNSDGPGPLQQQDIARVGFQKSVAKQVTDAGLYVETDEEARVLPSKRVVLTTLYHLGKVCSRPEEVRSSFHFATVIVDEAGAVLDAHVREALAACHGSVQKLILVGDHHQLQPIVKSQELLDKGYGRSPLERAVDEGCRCVMLKEQWRMAPSIRALVSKLAYDNQLRDAPDMDVQSRGGSVLPPLNGRALLVVDLGFGKAISEDETGSLKNREEARAVRDVIDVLEQVGAERLGLPPLEEGGDVRRFKQRLGVVTPYREHTKAVAAVLQGVSEEEAVGYAVDYDDTSSAPRQSIPGDVIVGTAHAFQGSEKDIMVLSPCYLSKFTSDTRILNVSLSRAKHLLVIVGRVSEMAARHDQAQLWRTIYTHCCDSRVGMVVPAQTSTDVAPNLMAAFAGAE